MENVIMISHGKDCKILLMSLLFSILLTVSNNTNMNNNNNNIQSILFENTDCTPRTLLSNFLLHLEEHLQL